ncbi:MAG: family ATPase [Patescibacteria group bacterium]|nr:family ATPase [Patescibacteria group bacterium]MDQ5970911.1 family ATPase [Patescibacteria group bacterium]
MKKFLKHNFKRGLVVGKFYPPHKGHKYLIDTAKSQCDELTVILCWKRSETIPGTIRAEWLKRIHPDVYIKVVEDNKLDDDDSEGWAKFTLDVLGYVPDAVFTSESYGDPYASFMGSIHVLVDRDRTFVPISATIVRSNPLKYSVYLEPCVRSHFAWRISVVGAESTGTTTLARDLAKHYNTVWVPEYGRLYSEGKLMSSEANQWRTEEFEMIAKTQNTIEDSLAENSNGLVICDTDSFATAIWHERYMGQRSAKVEEIASSKDHDLYILTGDEIPFVQDGTRDGEGIRHKMHQTFIQRLKEAHKNFIIVEGSPEKRLQVAIQAIDQLAKDNEK